MFQIYQFTKICKDSTIKCVLYHIIMEAKNKSTTKQYISNIKLIR